MEQPNVERPVFQNFEISNIKITRDELFDFSYFRIYFSFFYLIELFEHSKYMIIYKIGKSSKLSKLKMFWILQIPNSCNFSNCTFLIFFKLKAFGIFQIGQFWNFPNEAFLKFSELKIGNFLDWKFWNFRNWVFSEFSKLNFL